MKFKYTKIFALIALVLSIILFFNSSSILIYFLNVFFSIIAIGLIGLGIDFLINKRLLLGIIIIILMIGIIFIYLAISSVEMGVFGNGEITGFENLFTKECKEFYIEKDYKNPPWYYIQSDNCRIDRIEIKRKCSDSNGTIISFNEECPENHYYSAAAYHDVRPGFKCCLPE